MSSDHHGAPAIISSGLKQPYHLVDPSPWPLVGALGGGLTLFGVVIGAHFSNWLPLIAGLLTVLATMFFWWRDVLKESRTAGVHTPVVRLGLRYGMMFFITSEVMFFVAFFWAFFHFALFPEHVLGMENPTWPPAGEATPAPIPVPGLPAHARSACEPHRQWIEAQVRLGRNATAIYQELVDGFGFQQRYNSVKRFCRALRKQEPEQFDRLEFLPGE